MVGEKITAIVKPTHACNLSCKYCYVGKEAEQGRMDQSTLEKVISQLSALPRIKDVHFIWHGGEPLTMGLGFYMEVAKIQDTLKGKGVHFSNGIQTNATLVTDELLDFIDERKDFRLGFSMDGPPEIHNQVRVYKDGHGSFDDVLRGMTKVMDRRDAAQKDSCKRKQIGRSGVVVVMSKVNVTKPDEMYAFFKGTGINMKANPLIYSGSAVQNIAELGITPRQYGDFLVRLFDLWFNDPEFKIDIDPLSMIMVNC